MAQAKVSQQLSVLLVGKTGAGKSATGNTLLNRKIFAVSGAAKSVTKSIKAEYSKEADGRILKVIDGPGLEDTDLSDERDKSRLIENIGQALGECNGAINALVVVMKYGDRHTAENRKCFNKIMNAFGENMLQHCGIVVLTCANNWYDEFSEETNFQSWCKAHNSDYGGIFAQCSYRCVVIENTTRSPTEKEAQKREILSKVSLTRAYTSQNFKEAAKDREINACLVLKESYQRKISLLIQDLSAVSDTSAIKETSSSYQTVEQKAKNLLNQVQKDNKHGVLTDLQTQLEGVIRDAKTSNDEALKRAAKKLQMLKDDRKWKVGKAVLAGIATAITAGIAAPVFATALDELDDHDNEIAKYTA